MFTIRLLDFLLLNATILLSSLIVVCLFNKEKKISSAKLFLSVTTIFFSQIILIEILLGSLSLLSYKSLTLTASSIFILLLCLLLYGKIKIPEIEKPKKIPKVFTIVIFAPLLILLITRLGKTILEIPMEYDSLAYHLPFVVKWLQTSSILQPYFTAFAGPIGYYPGNFELITLFTILPFNNDFFSSLINFLLYIPVAICFFAILKNFKIRKKLSLTLAAALLYMPIMVNQTGTQLVEVFFILSFLLSIYFVQENYKKHSHSNSMLFGLSMGLFLGTKYLAIPYAIIPITVFIVLNFKPKKILIFLFGTFLIGSFFYFRNIFLTGNPVFPAELQIFGFKIFEGFGNFSEQLKNTSILANFNAETIKKVLIATYQNMGYQGILLGLFLPVTLIFLIYKTLKKKKLPSKLKPLALIITSAVISTFIYLNAPNTNIHIPQNTRYALPIFVLAIITAGILISQFKKFRLPFLLLLLASIFYTFFSFDSLKISSFDYKKTLHAYTERENNFPTTTSLMEAIQWLNKNAPDGNIAYSGFNTHYHLYGRNFRRKVDYININDCSNCDYFDFKNSPDGIRSNPDFSSWLENLRDKNKKYLIIDIDPKSQVKMYEQDWAEQYSKIFQLVFSEGSIYVYRIT